MERVGHGDECQVIIEDGEIVSNKFERQPENAEPHPQAVEQKPFTELFPGEALEMPKRSRKRPIVVPPTV